MPELPEVEVSRLGITPHLEQQKITQICIRQKQLRWPIPDEVLLAQGQVIEKIERRAKYLLLHTRLGAVILHLGMSGKLRVVPQSNAVQKHDHLDIVLENGLCLRFNDARRFGACLWQPPGQQHELMANLGPEPLTDEFDGQRLFDLSRNKTQAVKNFIMDNKVVVGVGNIYACESLFAAGLDPRQSAKGINLKQYLSLSAEIKKVLAFAITQGGTTLKDFTQADGSPGYFAQKLNVYGRKGDPCFNCEQPIQSQVIGQRNTFFCEQCQS